MDVYLKLAPLQSLDSWVKLHMHPKNTNPSYQDCPQNGSSLKSMQANQLIMDIKIQISFTTLMMQNPSNIHTAL